MRKKMFLAIVTALIVGVMCACFLVGCGDNEKNGDKAGSISVTFYGEDGKSVLEVKKVEKGGKVSEWTPKNENDSKFIGWYSTPTYTAKFDFGAKIDADTSVYSMWASTIKDDRVWQIAGQFSGKQLKNSNWGEDGRLNSDKYALRAVDDKFNTVSITVDLYVGDKFQFAVFEYIKGAGDTYSREWRAQKGFGLLDAPDGCFNNGGSDQSSVVNQEDIVCARDGKYRFTAVTDIKSNNVGRIACERIADAEPLEVEFTPAIMGTFNGYQCGTASANEYIMKQTDEDGLEFSVDVSLNVGDLMLVLPFNNYAVQVTAGRVDKSSTGVKSAGHEIQFTKTAEFTVKLTATPDGDNFTYSLHISEKGEYKTNAAENKYTVEYRSAAEGTDYTVYLKNGARFPLFVEPTLAEGQTLMGWHLKGAGENGENVGIETEANYAADGTAGGKIGYGVTTVAERDTRAYWIKGTGGYANDEEMKWLDKKIYLTQTGDHEYTAYLDLFGQVMEFQVCEDYLGKKTGKYFRNFAIKDYQTLDFIDQNGLANITFKKEGYYKLVLDSMTGVITVTEEEYPD